MTGGALPTGTVTFLFTDIEGSTDLLQQLGDSFDDLIEAHHAIMRTAVRDAGGTEVSTEGDAFFVAFERPGDAVECAVAAQRALGAQAWPGDRRVRVRMGIHTGDVRLAGDNYVGLSVHVAARISSAAHGGQIVVSRVTADLIGAALPEGVSIKPLGPHRLKDLREPAELVQICHPALDQDFPILRTLSALPNNLPTQLTSFVGRENDVAEVVAVLEENRIVSLVGAGGVGKTRLAIQAAAELATTFHDGVWFVDLAPVRDPDLVLHATASSIGIAGEPGRSPMDSLTDQLVKRASLIVVDNCEHLVASVATMVETLAKACPDLKFLTTSREPLGIGGEVVWRVPSLDEDESARLFTDRATQGDATFTLSSDDAAAVSSICRRLDGIPLAIELAAARVGALSCAQIADRLDDRFRLLTGGSRTALGRQQTLRALIDWSYELLDEHERTLFHRLSVFIGTFSLEGVERVCSSDDLPEHEILDAVSRLVEKSLVTVRRETGTRYRLLETMRQYAYAKLMDSGETAGVRDRHLDWYVSLLEVPGADPSDAGNDSWLERVDGDYDNVRAAMEWAIDRADSERAQRMVTKLGGYWGANDLRSEGREWAERAIAIDAARTTLRAETLAVLASIQASQYDWVDAYPHAEEAVSIYRDTSDRKDLAVALALLASIEGSEYIAKRDDAIAHFEECLTLFDELHDEVEIVSVRIRLALMGMYAGELRDAERTLEAALPVARRLANRSLLWSVLINLQHIVIERGDRPRAIALGEEAAALGRELSPATEGRARRRLMGVLVGEGRVEEARAQWKRVMEIAEELTDWWDLAHLYYECGALGRRLDPSAARTATERSLALVREGGTGSGVGGNLRILAHHDIAERRFAEARRLFEESLAIEAELGSRHDAAEIHYNLARLALCEGDRSAHDDHMRTALRHASAVNVMACVAACLDAFAFRASEDNEHQRASLLLGASDELRERTGAARATGTQTSSGRFGEDAFYDEDILMSNHAHYTHARESASAGMGAAAFELAYRAGRALTIEDAVALADSAET